MKLHRISQTIYKALNAAGLRPSAMPHGRNAGVTDTWTAFTQTLRDGVGTLRSPLGVPPREAHADVHAEAPPAATGELIRRTFSNASGSRDYLLYVPTRRAAGPAPLIVMLHGCKQNAGDFATGTRMNALAELHGFLVAYPEQTARENGANCWNWFEPAHQGRAGAEPAILAGIANEIVRNHAVDPGRVFVAGLSAGAAMALILATTHPEVFRGVAAHSGLPVGAANGVSSAFAAMRGRPSPFSLLETAAVPTFVIHGDADSTVDQSNGAAIVEQATAAYARAGAPLSRQPQAARSCGGRAVSVTTFVDPGGQRRIEQWDVGGGAHTWFGGNPRGSYTDASGPDASTEIVRFFLSQGAPS